MKLEVSVQELELFFTKFHFAEEQKNKEKTPVARTTSAPLTKKQLKQVDRYLGRKLSEKY